MGGTIVKSWVRLPITGGLTVIDLEDLGKTLEVAPWYVSDRGYAVKKTRLRGKNVNYRLHRVLTDALPTYQVDHVNGNRLDNRKSNLRMVTQRMNTWNRTVGIKHSVYASLPRGVTYDKQRDKFVARKAVFKRFDTLKQATDFMEEERNGGQQNWGV